MCLSFAQVRPSGFPLCRPVWPRTLLRDPLALVTSWADANRATGGLAPMGTCGDRVNCKA
jgi:hypothetical protein